MTKLFLTLFTFICLNGVFAQNESPIITLWDSIPQQDLAMTTYEPDTSAAAVVLLDYGYLAIPTLFHRTCQLTTLHRVKIFKKSAFDDYGKHTLTIRGYERLLAVRAQTINPDGSRTPVTEFFEEKVNESVTYKKFAFPKLQEGSIIEYEYTVESGNLFELYPWYFQEVIPVRHSELVINIPNQLNYVYLLKGNRELKQGVSAVKTPLKFAKTAKIAIDSFYSYYLDTVEAMKPEGFITTMNDYTSNLKFQFKSSTSLWGGVTDSILANWTSLSQHFLANESLGLQISNKKKYNDIWKAIKPLLEKDMTAEEKIRICYEYISKNVTWIDDYFSIYIQETLEDAFKKKKANSGELNLMLIACLNEAGIKANPMLISTRDHGEPCKDHPIRQQFNHLLCYIPNDTKPMFLDAGNIYRPMSCPRIPSLNGSGFVLDAKNPRWVDITPPLSTQTVLANCVLSADGNLAGTFAEAHTGYSGVNERTNLKDDDKNEKIKKAWAHTFPDIQLDSIQIINKDSVHLPFKRTMAFNLPNAAIVADDLLYIKPTLKTDFDESPFKQSKRNYPVDMPHPIKDNFVLNLTLPEDFTVEELPKEAKIMLPNNGGSYIYSCSLNNNQVQFNVRIHIKQLHYPQEEYKNIKDFFDLIASKQAEQIVLKRKSDKK